MDRWKAEMGRVREKRREEERERVRRKKIQVREKVGMAPERRKVGSLKRRVRSHLARWVMRDEKLHAVVAKHISKSKCTKHLSFGPLLEVAMSKKCTPLWREAHFEVKMYKTHHCWTLLEVEMSKKCNAVVAQSTFRSQNVKNTRGSDHFWTLRMSVPRGRRKGFRTLPKVSKTWGFCTISKNDGKRGTFEEDLGRCIFRGRRSTRDMFIRAVRRSGRWFPFFFVAGAVV